MMTEREPSEAGERGLGCPRASRRTQPGPHQERKTSGFCPLELVEPRSL